MERDFVNVQPTLQLEERSRHARHWVMRLLGVQGSLGCSTCTRFPEIDERCRIEANKRSLKMSEGMANDRLRARGIDEEGAMHSGAPYRAVGWQQEKYA